MIRDHNAKIADLEGLLGPESKHAQKAFRKDLDDCIARLSACRANLQSAVDGAQELQFANLETDMETMTAEAEELMKKMQNQVLAFSKKKSFTKVLGDLMLCGEDDAFPALKTNAGISMMGKSSCALDVPDLAGKVARTSELVFDMIDNVAAAGSVNREMRSAKSTDAAGLLPAPLKKLGTFSGKNSARDFAQVNEDEPMVALFCEGLNSRLHHTFREEDAMRSGSSGGQTMPGKSRDQNGKIPPSFVEKTIQNCIPEPVCEAQKVKKGTDS
ncbi:unnamed protein product [Symbiodinium sp. CCMP2592]|nr:unnamed protein product [Symbiodinium sp. CCMP2592]